MKNELIEKVNKMGKIGLIFSNIGKVVMIISMIVCIILACVFVILPQDFASIKTVHNAIIDVNLEESMDMGVSFVETNDDGKTTIELNGIIYELTSLEQDGQNIEAKAQSEESTLTLRELSPIVLFAALFCGVAVEVFCLISRLCKHFKECETPFTEEISNVLHKLAFAVIPLVVLGSMVESAIEGAANGQFNVMINIDLTMVVVVVLILMLSSIFRYGTLLQQESDETL